MAQSIDSELDDVESHAQAFHPNVQPENIDHRLNAFSCNLGQPQFASGHHALIRLARPSAFDEHYLFSLVTGRNDSDEFDRSWVDVSRNMNK